MANKRKRKKTALTASEIPAGPLLHGLSIHTKQRNSRRALFASFQYLSSAFDELLDQLRVISESDGLDPEIVHLLVAAQRWIIDGVDRILSDAIEHEADESRKLLELEYLLRDFAAIPENVHKWAELETWQRPKNFDFGKLRGREEARLGLDDSMVIAARDYWITHSRDSHPKPMKDESPKSSDDGRVLLSALGDLMGHAVSVVEAAKLCVNAQGATIPVEYSKLSTVALSESWKRMHSTLHAHIPEDVFRSLKEPRPRKSTSSGAENHAAD